MNILITGGAGFIGSHLSEHLVAKGHKVTVVDSLLSGYKSNLCSIMEELDFYEEKIEYFDFKKLKKIDSVVHLASQVSVPVSVNSFGASSSQNLLGTIKIIDFCRNSFTPLVFASSSAVYGDLEIGDDNNSSVNLLSPYAADKYAMELYAKLAYQLYNLSSIGLRFYNVYGPRQDPTNSYSGVISIFINRLLSGQDITINGGFQTRDFIYVQDIITAIDKAISITKDQIICEQVNILTGKSVTINYIADFLIQATGSKSPKIFKELPEGDPKQSKGTIKKMEQLLGINSNDMVKLESGLNETIDFFKKQQN